MLDIRMYAREKEHFRGIEKLADLFHNFPLHLIEYHKGKQTIEQVLSTLRARAEYLGMSEWLEGTIRDNFSNQTDTSKVETKSIDS